ncbi:hypothetical protein WCE34_14250 [Luteimonas sp. MJ204]|uniref:hypothetical protein n=1 Tax=Luteimonas sp. MJ145 TaxID=3129234 RepID=UPI0031BAFAA5
MKKTGVGWEVFTNVFIWAFFGFFVLCLFAYRAGEFSFFPATQINQYIDWEQILLFIAACFAAWITLQLIGRYIFGSETDKKNASYFGGIVIGEMGSTLVNLGSLSFVIFLLAGEPRRLLLGAVAIGVGWLIKRRWPA